MRCPDTSPSHPEDTQTAAAGTAVTAAAADGTAEGPCHGESPATGPSDPESAAVPAENTPLWTPV